LTFEILEIINIDSELTFIQELSCFATRNKFLGPIIKAVCRVISRGEISSKSSFLLEVKSFAAINTCPAMMVTRLFWASAVLARVPGPLPWRELASNFPSPVMSQSQASIF